MADPIETYQQRLIDAHRASAFVGEAAAIKLLGAEIILVAKDETELAIAFSRIVGKPLQQSLTYRVCVVRESDTSHNLDKVPP